LGEIKAQDAKKIAGPLQRRSMLARHTDVLRLAGLKVLQIF
jgi:hypothetical protein